MSNKRKRKDKVELFLDQCLLYFAQFMKVDLDVLKKPEIRQRADKTTSLNEVLERSESGARSPGTTDNLRCAGHLTGSKVY